MKSSEEMIEANKFVIDNSKPPFYIERFPCVAFYPLRQPQIMPRIDEEDLKEIYAKDSAAPTNGK